MPVIVWDAGMPWLRLLQLFQMPDLASDDEIDSSVRFTRCESSALRNDLIGYIQSGEKSQQSISVSLLKNGAEKWGQN